MATATYDYDPTICAERDGRRILLHLGGLLALPIILGPKDARRLAIDLLEAVESRGTAPGRGES